MSYVRWSDKVRQGCTHCGGTGFVRHPTLDGGTHCDHCRSCWYIWDDTSGCLAIHHGRCVGPQVEVRLLLPYEEAAGWRPPAECPMGDVALAAVAEALADHAAEADADRG